MVHKSGDLSLRSRRGRGTVRIRDDELLLDGRRNWIVEGPAEKIERIVEDAGSVAEALGTGVAVLDFGNAVGRVDLPYLGSLNVVSGKWGTDEFDEMLSQVIQRSAELPFRAGETGALPYQRSIGSDHRILYHCFVYLQYVLSAAAPPPERLDVAYRTVLRDPQREWRRGRQSVPIGRAVGVDAKSLLGMVTGTDRFEEVGTDRVRSTHLSRTLGGRLPARVDERRDYSSLDTPENRFLKALLGQIGRIIDDMEAAAEKSDRSRFRRNILAECEEMRRSLRPVTRHSIWGEVGEMRTVPTSSTVLQRRRGYRELFQHYARLRMSSRLPLSEDEGRDLLEIKDIALLYELWTYFRLSSVIEGVLGHPSRAATVQAGPLEARLGWETVIRWPQGVRLTYNPRFSRSKPQDRRTYSVPLRPDISLEVPGPSGPRLHLFDAKFRIRSAKQAVPTDEVEAVSDDREQEERRGDFKRADLYKMHTYRDAIPRVESVWILYPGTEGRFFGTDGRTWNSEKDLVPTNLDGVGALPLVPSRADHRMVEAVAGEILRPPGKSESPSLGVGN